MLVDKKITLTDRPLTPLAQQFLGRCQSLYSSIYVFDFIQSNHELAWRTLDALPRGKFCEWGSGFGLITGLAEMLGFDASGIELDERLADASRSLFAEFGLNAKITTGSYFEQPCTADVVYVYCWPGREELVEVHFESAAPSGSQLLICCTDTKLHVRSRPARFRGTD